MRKFTMTLAAALLVAMTGTANAAYIGYGWSDTYDPYPDFRVPPTRHYTHDLTVVDADDGPGLGFRPLTDFIAAFTLQVHLYDDGTDGIERALVDVPGVIGDRYYFDLTGSEFGGWSLAGWVLLNLTGKYDVTVESKRGDFMFGASWLNARGLRYVSDTRPVPEPGTLALLSLGLIGMGIALSRRRGTPQKKS